MHFHEESGRFSERRALSWTAKPVNLDAVGRGAQRASGYRDGFQAEVATVERLASIVLRCAWAPIVWEGGKCLTSGFLESGWMTLDFDETPYTIDQALRDWSDTVHVLGTTKSHQVEKDGKPPKDRFRIIAPWTAPITSAATYRYNMERLVDRYDADRTCIDAARFFWPCRKILSVQLEGYLQDVEDAPERELVITNRETLAAARAAVYDGGLPPWIAAFVREGRMPHWKRLHGSRKWACNEAARWLRDLGWTPADVLELLHSAKFNRSGFDPGEIDAAVATAFKPRRGRCGS